MTYKIEKNIPIIGSKSGFGRPKKYQFPFDDMDIGDSFFLYGTTRTPEIASAKFDMTKLHRKSNKRFASRKYTDGVRFWRINDEQ